MVPTSVNTRTSPVHQPRRREAFHDGVGAVGGGVGGDQDFEAIGLVVQIQAVLELGPYAFRFVMGGDDQGNARRLAGTDGSAGPVRGRR
jgi:hypothetical protein